MTTSAENGMRLTAHSYKVHHTPADYLHKCNRVSIHPRLRLGLCQATMEDMRKPMQTRVDGVGVNRQRFGDRLRLGIQASTIEE